jgi:hypothetical protein
MALRLIPESWPNPITIVAQVRRQVEPILGLLPRGRKDHRTNNLIQGI